jgi:hypothetical protein
MQLKAWVWVLALYSGRGTKALELEWDMVLGSALGWE